jgi:16S rRNA (cytosine967-C5)-methyltransferase
MLCHHPSILLLYLSLHLHNFLTSSFIIPSLHSIKNDHHHHHHHMKFVKIDSGQQRSFTSTTILHIANTIDNISDNDPSSSSNREKIPMARIVAAQSIMENNISKKKNNNHNINTNNPVTKLESNPNFTTLSQRDKSFARNIVSTTIRRKGQIDNILSIICNKKYPANCGRYSNIVNACLRIGVVQILFMEVKDFAAVKETVNVLKWNDKDKSSTPDRFVKFVNAILRRVVKEGRDILETQTCISDNVIPWLLSDWIESYGEEKTMKMIEQLMDANSHQHVDLSLNIKHLFRNNDIVVQDEIQPIIDEFQSSSDDNQHGSIILLPNKSLRIKKGTENVVSNFPLYNEGSWWVQDVSSTLPAIGLISAMNNRYDDFSKLHIVDMCAAPGGKTSQLLAAGFGKVTAIENNQRRCRRLRENLSRLGLQDRCEVVVSTGQDWFKDDGSDDIAAILLDVPCSATGLGMRRPDVMQKGTNDLDSLLEIQEILANHCINNILSKGGILVYATCSLLKRESEDQVKKLIQRGIVETLPFTPGELGPGFDDAIDSNGWLRLLPGALSGELKYCDGFFVARLIKT